MIKDVEIAVWIVMVLGRDPDFAVRHEKFPFYGEKKRFVVPPLGGSCAVSRLKAELRTFSGSITNQRTVQGKE